MGQSMGISDSEFNMWRAVFAFALVDNVLSLEEQEMLRSYKAQVPFSLQQLQILSSDFSTRQDVEGFFKKITEDKDKKRFCVLARAIVWSDGDMDKQEEEILKRVACLKTEEHRHHLVETRGHRFIDEYYQQYAKAGVVGLSDTPHILQMQI